MNGILFRIFLIFFSASICLAQSENEVTFLNVKFPPLWILDGSYKGKGLADKAETYIKQNLRSYKYTSMEVTVARAEHFMTNEKKRTFCAVPHGKDFFKNVQESKVWAALSGHVLVTRQGIINKVKLNKGIWNNKDQISLDMFLKYFSGFNGVITKNQRYPLVDTYIDDYKGKRIKEIVGSDMLNLYKMVINNRSDYTFSYESSVKYMQLVGMKVEFLVLQELNNHKIPIVIGCNDTKLARKFIKTINEHIKELRRIGTKQNRLFHTSPSWNFLKKYIDGLSN